MVWDTVKSIFVTGQDIWDTGKWSMIQVNPVFDTGQDIWDTGKWSGILVSGLGYWSIHFCYWSRHLGYW